MRICNPVLHHQNVALEVPGDDLVDSDILKTSLLGYEKDKA